MMAAQKHVKNTKGMVLEMPELFTYEELVREFAKGTKSRLQQETEFNTIDLSKSGAGAIEMGRSMKKLEAFVDSLEDIAEEEGNVLLEDAFLSHNVPSRSSVGLESHFGLGISRITNRT